MAHGRQPGIIALEWTVLHSGSGFKDAENIYKSKSWGDYQSKYLSDSNASGRALPDEFSLWLSSDRGLFHMRGSCGIQAALISEA
jgi:hypothetical protein